ncbi:MAG: 16S rRNA (cytosine(967)-C(5))-methyltransferase RsmB [Rhodothermales bacterium]
MNQPSSRASAVRQLNRIELEGASISDVGEAGIDARDHRQVREYVAGVTRWRRWLDFVLGQYYRGDLSAMEPTLRQVLRVGLYDLLFLHTPEHAALNEAVQLAKTLVRPGAGGLVNAVLRNAQRNQDRLPEPIEDDPAEALGIRYSHPTWMVRRWLDRYGRKSTIALLEWNNTRPVYALRVNTLKTDVATMLARCEALGVRVEPSPYVPEGLRVDALQPLIRGGVLSEGLCTVQDESAMLVVHLLDPQPGDLVVDVCAAPGGKSFFAASLMRNQGRIVAADVQPERLSRLETGMKPLGISIVETRAMDAAQPDADLRATADRVLLDAPCTGLGVLAKRADLRWKRTEEELSRVVSYQATLLDAAAEMVRPGGLLVYSTCTIAPEENEQQVERFLKRHDQFVLESAGAFVPEALVNPLGHLATLPQRHGIDGAFAARMRRRISE